MKNLQIILLLASVPFSLSAEKKVSKVYDAYLNETYNISYDEEGRLINWTVYYKDIVKFNHSFDYVSNDKIIVSGITDRDESYMEVSLNEEGLVKEINVTVANDKAKGEIEYQDNLMSNLTWMEISEDSDETVIKFEINNGNPEKIISDYWSRDYPIITYSDKPNKAGLIYLPMITCNTLWGYRSLAYAGLLGKGSRNLPSSCRFDFDEPAASIEYQFDEEGYVTYMKTVNANDGDGEFYFEYIEVNCVEDISNPVVNVIGQKGRIDIHGEYNSAKVYNLNGILCSSENLTAGIYIVDVDGIKHKVIVR